MAARTSRITPVTLVLAVLVALIAAQLGVPRLASQDLGTPIVDPTETPPSGAGIDGGGGGEVSTLATSVTISHAFSNDTPSPGETIEVTVTVSGSSDTSEIHVARETITAPTAPYVTGDPQVSNEQNILRSSLQREEDGFFGDYTTLEPGTFALTVTYPVTIDPAATGTMEFTTTLTLLDGTPVTSDTATLTITPVPTTTASISHAFSNDTPSAGETIEVTVTVSGEAGGPEILRFFEQITSTSSPFVLSEPMYSNFQNAVITQQPPQAPYGYGMEFSVPAPGPYGFTLTYTVTTDPAETGPMGFHGWVQYMDETHIGDDTVSLPVTQAPTPTATSTSVPPTATTAPVTNTANVTHVFSNTFPRPGDTITVTVPVAGEADAGKQLRLVEDVATGSTPLVHGQPELSNQQNVTIITQYEVPAPSGTGTKFFTDFTVPATGHFELTLTYTITIDPAETGPLGFYAEVFDQLNRGQLLADDTDTLALNLPATNTPTPTTPEPTATTPPEPTATNTPEPTATSTSVPPTKTPEPTATATEVPATNTPVPATNTPEPTEEPRGSAVITLETSDGADIPGATILCVGDACLTVGEQAPRAFMAAQGPVGVPSGSTFTFDDLPLGTFDVTATDASPYLDASSSVTTTEGEPAAVTLVLQLDEPEPSATAEPQPTESDPTAPQPTDTSPVTTLPETGNGQPTSSVPWALLAAAGLLLASAGLIVRRTRQPMGR